MLTLRFFNCGRIIRVKHTFNCTFRGARNLNSTPKSLVLYEELRELITQKPFDARSLPHYKRNVKGIFDNQHFSTTGDSINYINLLGRARSAPACSHVRFHTTSTTTNSTPNEVVGSEVEPPVHTFDNNDDYEELEKMFPSPKNVLHNCFDILQRDFEQNNVKVIPHFRHARVKNKASQWSCTYTLKWPEPIKFTAVAVTKQDASHRAALAALSWLRRNEKISKEGHPLFYDKKHVKDMVLKTLPVLQFEAGVRENIGKLLHQFNRKVYPQLNIKSSPENEIVNEEDEGFAEDWSESMRGSARTHRPIHNYLCREQVPLPISGYKEDIQKAIENNRIVVIKGEPGCGKSTRVPQYILDSWAKREIDSEPCRIVVTQPRRIAAISLAERVASEIHESVGPTVGFRIRLQSNFNEMTGRIMYCTTGILLRRLQSDPRLSECTHIILDEAHERDVNTDLLMNLLRFALEQNPNLKLLVMSATIDTEIFQKYFKDAAVLNIPGFTYPVKEAFLEEIEGVDLRKTLTMSQGFAPSVVCEDVAKFVKHLHKTKPEGAILVFLPGWEEITRVKKLLPDYGDMSVLCLHSRLQVAEQRRIFSRPPPGVRKIILTTNIAETSVTVDDVVYVVDTGIHKEQNFDASKGVMCIDNHWISKASMMQRKGRAGRCRSGESFHLYPKNKYNNFIPYALPEILRISLTKIVLDAKVYSNNMPAQEFLSHLLSPPDQETVEKAVEELKELELLDGDENVTTLGRALSEFQLDPKLCKALFNSVLFKCVTPIIDIVTIFSAETELFATGLMDKARVNDVKHGFCETSDHLAFMRLFENWLEFEEANDTYTSSKFCNQVGLVPYKLQTIRKLRTMYFESLRKGLNAVLPLSDDYSDNDELVKAVLLSGVGNVIQHRDWEYVKGKFRTGRSVYVSKNNHKSTITPESVNFRKRLFRTNFLLYIHETMNNIRRSNVIRETSQIPLLTVLLFTHHDFIVEKIPESNSSPNLESNDQVYLKLKGTKFQFICDRSDVTLIQELKNALRSGMQYYTYQLTTGGEVNRELNQDWDQFVRTLGEILEMQSIR